MANDETSPSYLAKLLANLALQVGDIQNEIKTLKQKLTQEESSINSSGPRSRTTREIREELEVITEFGGHNISVETFISELKQSASNLPNHLHDRFVRLVVTKKIIREARQAIDGLELKTIDDVIAALRNEYGYIKSYDLAMTELSQCVQGRDDVEHYNQRFNAAYRNWKRSLANDPAIVQEHKAVLFANEDRIALPQFIQGLKPTIRGKVQAFRP